MDSARIARSTLTSASKVRLEGMIHSLNAIDNTGFASNRASLGRINYLTPAVAAPSPGASSVGAHKNRLQDMLTLLNVVDSADVSSTHSSMGIANHPTTDEAIPYTASPHIHNHSKVVAKISSRARRTRESARGPHASVKTSNASNAIAGVEKARAFLLQRPPLGERMAKAG